MARCEDFPCCGHELGCCPDYDKTGKQLNMVCTCGTHLPINNKSSICDTCLNRNDEDYYDDNFQYPDDIPDDNIYQDDHDDNEDCWHQDE
jgi:hypothetical protein